MDEEYLSTAMSMAIDLKRRGVHTEISSSFSDIDEYVVTIHKAVINYERMHSPLRGLAKQLENQQMISFIRRGFNIPRTKECSMYSNSM